MLSLLTTDCEAGRTLTRTEGFQGRGELAGGTTVAGGLSQ